MKRIIGAVALPVLLLLLLFAVACNGDGDESTPTGTPTETPTPTATETESPTPTEPPEDLAICLLADEYLEDGSFNIESSPGIGAYRISDLRWAAYEGCERFVLDIALPVGNPAQSPGSVSASWDRDLGVLSLHLEDIIGVSADATDAHMGGEMLDRVYVVREGELGGGENTVQVQLHVASEVEAAVFLLNDPARVVVDFRPGGSPIPPLAEVAPGILVRSPRAGEASYPLTVTGYSRNFEANVVVRIEQDGVTHFEDNTTANDWTEMWGWFELTIDSGPSGPIELHVGDYSAATGDWEGAVVELEMP